MSTKNNKLREELAATFIQALEQKQLPWRALWTSSVKPYNVISKKSYKGINAFWLSYIAEHKGYKDPRWCSFKQAQDKGWKINKGEKGSYVEFWSIYDSKTNKTISFEEADKIAAENPEREKDLKIFFRNAVVFNAEQIDGIPKLELQEAQNTLDIETIKGQRDTLFKNMNLGFKEGGDQAYYQPASDTVTMPPVGKFESDYAYMSVMLHECGHATGHESRLSRPLLNLFGTDAYAKEELRAEIASAFTAQELGFGANEKALNAAMDNHKAYIQSWVQQLKEKPDELFKAIKDAEKISDYLLEKGEFKQLKTEKAKEQAQDQAKDEKHQPPQEQIKAKSR